MSEGGRGPGCGRGREAGDGGSEEQDAAGFGLPCSLEQGRQAWGCLEPSPPSIPASAHQHSPEMGEIFSLRLTLLAKYNSSSFFPAKNTSIKTIPAALAEGGGRETGSGEKEAAASNFSASRSPHSGTTTATWQDDRRGAAPWALSTASTTLPCVQMRKKSPERARHLPQATQQS